MEKRGSADSSNQRKTKESKMKLPVWENCVAKKRNKSFFCIAFVSQLVIYFCRVLNGFYIPLSVCVSF